MYWYIAYGLTFASDLPLPELSATEPGDADVLVSLEPVPERLDRPETCGRIWQASKNEWLQTVDGVGRFHVADGARIAIEQWGSDREVRAFLFGSTLGALLHQMGVLTLHASSFLSDGGAVMVAGNSRAGKSTTLAEMIGRGHVMVTDDKTVVLSRDERLVTVPGFSTMRLWRDAVTSAGLDVANLQTVRDNGEKFLWQAPRLHSEPLDLRALFLLAKGDVEAATVERCEGQAAFSAVLSATYRRDAMVGGMGVRDAHFRLAARLAAEVPVFRVTRPRRGDSVAQVADAIASAA